LSEWNARVWRSLAIFASVFAGVGGSSDCLVFPDFMPFTWNPISGGEVPLKVSITIPISGLQQLQEGIAQCGVHAHALPWMIAANSMPREAFLEKSLIVRAPAIQMPRWSHTRGISSTFASRVMPSAEGVACSIQRAELTNSCICTGFPRCLE